MKFIGFIFYLLTLTLLLAACQRDEPVPPETQGGQTENTAAAQSDESIRDVNVIAYYMGDGADLERFDFNQLTHVIYSFLHLDGNQLSFDSESDKAVVQRLVALKQRHPHLKVIVALGGWGGCETCSEVFSKAENRLAFADSTLDILQAYDVDGIDLDWEYPTIPGHPGHVYAERDKASFTALAEVLRATLGEKYELSFAAGGFDEFLQNAVDWQAIMPLFDRVHLMSYDIVNGATPHTGHHTSLYSTPEQRDSTNNAVQFLINNDVPSQKIVIGAAFYSRNWRNVNDINHGLYQPGEPVAGINFKDYAQQYTQENGYRYYWDDVAKAPSVYNAEEKLFATFDDKRSIEEKILYIKQLNLGGIMFWQLPQDANNNGLLDTIYRTLHTK